MTHFNWLVDGSIVGIYLLATMVVGIMVRKYVGKVEHFLVAGREVDVFLGIASLGGQGRQDGCQIYTRTSFFFACRFVLPGIWGIAALTALAPEALAGLPHTFQEQDASLYAMPIFLGQFVPVGLMGLLLAAMLAADMSSTSSYMITWTSVIYNDILAPFRKTPWSEKRGLLWNRVIVSLIGVFLLLYGLWYPLKGDVYAYLMVTGAIYLASISTMLIACCYWKRANSWGATGSIIVALPFPSPAWCSSKCGACLRTRCSSGGATRVLAPSWLPEPLCSCFPC